MHDHNRGQVIVWGAVALALVIILFVLLAR